MPVCRIGLQLSLLPGQRWLIAWLFWGLLLASPASAQIRFDHWTTEQGLPQNSVLAITQTPDGYLWLTTFNGLVRFDGVRFTVFDKNNTKEFSTNRISDLFPDATGALWIGTAQNGVLRYQNNRFTIFTKENGLPNDSVRQIQGGRNGEVLVSTGAGPAWWRDGRFLPDAETDSENSLRVHLGWSGTYWSLNNNGLHARLAERVVHYSLPVEPKSMLESRIYEDRSGSVWVAAWRRGVFRVKDGKVTNYTKRLKLTADQLIWKIFEDRDGTLWFGTADAGLIRFIDEPGAEPMLYTTANGLSNNAIRSMYQDREGTLWVGTGGGGLNRLTPQFITGYSTANGLGGNIAHAVLADRAGNVWVCTQVGLSKISGGKVTNYTLADGLPLRGLQALYEDRAGRLWIGSSLGLCFFKDGRFSPMIPDLNVWAIREDRQGNLWVGTHFGLLKFKDDVKTVFTKRDGLPNDTVRAIHEDRQGTLWFGTEDGLVKYRDDRFTVVTPQNELAGSKTRQVWQIWSIYEDAEGVLWLGTFDGGLIRFKDGSFTNYTMAQGLYNNSAFQILEDARGHLWMSCFRGLYSVSKQQLNDFADGRIRAITCAAYGKADGMLSTDCNGGRQPSGIKTRDGKLWFTTLGGVAVVDQAAVNFNPLPPPVLIEGTTIDRAATPIGNDLRVTPGQINLEINYTATSFIKPEQVRFRYQLVGQDQDWVDARTRRTADYSYLPPGEYTFKVIAANSDGLWNPEGAQLRVVVLPAFYQTWWFRALALLALCGLAFAAYRWRIRQLRREQQRQVEFSRRLIDAHESERGRLAGELHDSLGQDLLVIKNWALVGLTTTEEDNSAREMLTEIANATSHAIEDCREISHNLRPHQLDFIGLTEALRAMINKVAHSSGLQIEAQLDDMTGALPKEAEINLYRIVQESLNNVVKHARAHRVNIAVKTELLSGKERAPRTIVRIEDDGRGFDPFDPAALSNGKRGLGLSSITERTQMLGGQVVIDSAPGRGTIVTVTIDPSH